MFELSNNTEVRGFVAHMQSIARKRAMLLVAATEHPDNKGRKVKTRIDAIQEQWEIVRRDLFKVLGVQLKAWNELVLPGTAESFMPFAGRDDLRISMRELKRRCDKARLKDPTITLMKSWDTATH